MICNFNARDAHNVDALRLVVTLTLMVGGGATTVELAQESPCSSPEGGNGWSGGEGGEVIDARGRNGAKGDITCMRCMR